MAREPRGPALKEIVSGVRANVYKDRRGNYWFGTENIALRVEACDVLDDLIRQGEEYVRKLRKVRETCKLNLER
ncbi:MAG: hypothetical protein PHZ19_03670 [Candidatus Thermoplasmatota archaeon]|jgi:hypothetical protein|nr:hypothetical protein [Candidatus Thermoplasmatota archaeon]